MNQLGSTEGGEILKRRIWKVLFIGICVLSFAAFSMAYAQQKKTGGGDIKYEAKGSSGPVLFSHDAHVTKNALKCTDCHTKIFKMKKEDLKMNKEAHGKDQHCGVCHNGKKAFSQTVEADCAKCHKK
jgi:c(7)-type cytochrome triheme protein